jgi:hypothetical protein
MSWYDIGNSPINSTYAPVGAPSTASIIAELDSTQLLTKDFRDGFQQNHRVTWIVGASTTAIFQLEHTNSTALTGALDTTYVQTPTGQSGQYVYTVRLGKDSRLRARLNSTAANACAFIQAEALT